MDIEFTEELKPSDKIPYNHVKLKTPIGVYVIDWKGWKTNPLYDISLNNDHIGTQYDLASAKNYVRNHLIDITNNLNGFIKGNGRI